jgi:quaternary ammonium compound-resistance protein SugE
MAWVALVLAGCFEVGFALSLKASEGFTRLGPSLAFAAFGAASFGLLSWSLRSLPVGMAYAVWTGIGAAGTALLGMVLFGESRDAGRLAAIALIVAGVVGLRLFGGDR